MDENTKLNLIAFAEAQILAAQKLIASLNDEADEETEDEAPAAPAKKVAAKKAAPKKAASKKVAPEPEPEEEEEPEEEGDEDEERRAELNAMKIVALRALAKKRGFKAEGVAAAGKDDLVEAIIADEKEEAAAESEDEEAEEETAEYSREDLEAMGVRKVKALAKEQGHTQADLAGLKLNEVIDLILGEGDAEEEAEDEDEGGEEEAYTRADFEAMSLAELKVIGRQYEEEYEGFVVPKIIKKEALIELLLGEEDEDE